MKARTLNHVLNPLAAALIAGGWLSVVPLSAEALDVTWVGTVGNWSDATNWNSVPNLPATDDNILINLSGAAVTFDSPASLTYGQMELGSATLNQAANDLNVVEFVAGRNSGENAVFNLSGTGSLNVYGSTVIGDSGNGSFTQNGGTFEQASINTLFMVGGNNGAKGTVTLYGGTFRILGNEEKIGGYGTGYFYQHGGDHQFAGGMYVGDYGYGEYHMLGGTLGPVLDSGGQPIGYSGIVMGEWGAKGKFFHSGGKVDVDSVTLARQAGSDGYYVMNGATAILNANGINIGHCGTGSFLQSAGSVAVAGNINIAGTAGISGSYELQGGNLQTEQLRIGNFGIGIFTQSGGTNTVATASGFSILVMAENVGSSGTYNLSGGTLNSEIVFVGDSDQAFFNHSGTGTHNVNDLALGIYKNAGEHGQGTYNLQGGTLNSGFVTVGNAGTGTFNQIGGDHNNSDGIVIANDTGSVGTYNLQGGTLNAGSTNIVVGQNGQGTLNITGGKLIADLLQVGAQGMLSGTGGVIEVVNLNNDGLVSPGNSPGVMAITGNYNQSASGVLKIEIDGLSSFDQLFVTGDANLGGTLDLYRLTGYTPQLGETFLILKADSDGDGSGQLNGTFDSLQIHGFGSGVAFNSVYDYGLGTFSVQVTAVPEPETWAMLLAGLGLVGWKLRQRQEGIAE